ncbi:MAG: hypothetical protein QM725_16975 [Lacibacter sp.]
MKQIFLIITSLVIIAGSTIAQDQLQQKDRIQKKDRIHQEDHLQLQDGKMYQVKEGVRTQLQSQFTLKNGTVCNPDGTCMLQNKKQIQLRNGECLDLEGNRYMNQNKFNKGKMMTERQMLKKQNKSMKQSRGTSSGNGTGNRNKKMQ